MSDSVKDFDLPWTWLDEGLRQLREQQLLRERRTVETLPGGRCRVDGHEFWNFAGNDYLGLAGDERVRSAAMDAIQKSGAGSRASALVTGRTPWHNALETRLAEIKHAESALLFPTGYAANVGTLTALMGADDVVFCDRLNHASLIDGCRLSGAKFRVYPHRDVDRLQQLLERETVGRRRFIVTDSLFSMDGTQAPLRELAEVADRFEAILIVDEAHATGIYGDHGTGLLEANRVALSRVVSVGTLSKAIGSQGGFITGPRRLIDWLWNSARTQMFSTALSPACCAAALAAIDLIEQEPERRTWLRETWQLVIQELRGQGWTVPEAVDGPIIPVIVETSERVLQLNDELRQHGVFVAAIRPPTVPRNTARLRVSLSYDHGQAGIDALLRAMHSARSPNM
ncbi:MAG: 8-amino-7-oxononanoate synthase [Planctomycetaceae bacterium]|nr:8-amino-7-oxononanoate synthase [Planctomycetaceae bacterium]